MKNLIMEYDALPRTLICGAIGGSKTYLILAIIADLLRTNGVLYVLDLENA